MLFKKHRFQASDFKFQLKWGFTLVEFLVVLGLLSITVSATLLFLTSILRGSNKANVTAEVKQNGQSVLDSLERQIRNATDIQPDLSDPGHIRLIRPNSSQYFHIKCFSRTIIANGWIGVVESASLVPAGGYVTITNTDPVSGVSVESCSFEVVPSTQGAISPPIVSISFLVNQGINAPSRQDFLADVGFQTTISLRRY